MYNDHKFKPLHIMLPKTKAFAKGYDGQTKWMYFVVEDVDVLERNIILFGIKSVLIYKKKLIASQSEIMNFLKPK